MKRTLLLVLLLAGLASAAVVVRLPLPDLVSRSELILEGRCLSVRSERDPEGLILTVVSVLVDRGYRGTDPGQRVEFRLPGGEVGDDGLVVPGVPTFREGEEVFLFLTPPSPRGVRLPVGLAQGKLRIVRDPGTGERRLERSLAGVDLVDPATGRLVDAPEAETRSYEAFRAEVERLVAAGR